jgi:hypothetical protein
LYIDNKIIGAYAYGWNFVKKPIAGVTPIEDIIAIADHETSGSSISISNLSASLDQTVISKISQRLKSALQKKINPYFEKDFSQLKLFSLNQGFNHEAMQKFSGFFSAESVSSIKTDPLVIKSDYFQIFEGDAVAVPLIKGDYEYSVSGTVTYIQGKKIYCFGHPFLNLGAVDFPLHKAEIITIMPAYDNSFKLAATRNMIGAITQDRSTSVMGELGKTPQMIPLTISLTNQNRNFAIEMINHPLLTPILSYLTLESVLTSEYQQAGYQSITVKGKIFIENEINIHINDIFNGTFSFDQFTELIMAISAIILNNNDKKVRIQKMDFEILAEEKQKNIYLENVILDRYSCFAGENIIATLFLKDERGKRRTEELTIQAPNLKRGSIYYLMIGDRSEIQSFESKNIKANYFPLKLNSLIRLINNLRKNNRIYLKLYNQAKGLYINGHEYSDLPESMQQVFDYNISSKNQSQIMFSTLDEYQFEVDGMVKGHKVFKLNIREK